MYNNQKPAWAPEIRLAAAVESHTCTYCDAMMNAENALVMVNLNQTQKIAAAAIMPWKLTVPHPVLTQKRLYVFGLAICVHMFGCVQHTV